MNSDNHSLLAQRSGYLNLLQIAGALSIVAFHIATPYSQAGWVVVELFFVMAGINMFSACEREDSLAAYAWSRVRRLCPELCAVWGIAVVFVVFGAGTAGMLWFIGTGPFFLQNLTVPLFQYTLPADALFTPLWFVAALLQLQVLLFATRRWWLRARPAAVLIVFACLGLASRLVFAWILGDSPRTLPDPRADALYCLPLSHVEGIVLGLMMGRGALPWIGRLLPVFGGLVLVLGAANVWLADGQVSPRSLGFEFPLRFNYSHVWGYSVLALAAASLCAKNGPLAAAVERTKRPLWLDLTLARLASLSYGVYVSHGIIMATGVNGSAWLVQVHAPFLRLLLFFITMLESFLVAWAFAWFLEVALPTAFRAGLRAARRWRPASIGETSGEETTG